MILSNLKIISGTSDNNIIGYNEPVVNPLTGELTYLPWYLSNDMKHFRKVSNGFDVIMGRLTWKTLPEKYRPLPNRNNIVLSRNHSFVAIGGTTLYSINEPLEHIKKNKEKVFLVIGGTQIYDEFLPYASELYLTKVHTIVPESSNNVLGPNFEAFINDSKTKIVSSETFQADEKNQFDHTIIHYKKELISETFGTTGGC